MNGVFSGCIVGLALRFLKRELAVPMLALVEVIFSPGFGFVESWG